MGNPGQLKFPSRAPLPRLLLLCLLHARGCLPLGAQEEPARRWAVLCFPLEQTLRAGAFIQALLDVFHGETDRDGPWRGTS